MKKAIFLDRDGVLNVKRNDYVKSEDELEIIPKIEKQLLRLVNAGYDLFILTNQSVINRGLISVEDESKINKKLLDFLTNHGVKISKIYICPHRPDENCLCRKPNIGMINQAVQEFEIDLTTSWFLGDSESDKEAATRAGCNFALVCNNLNIVVDQILTQI
ncbi:D-glycero-alpha-D-manno-heptose-1,7-bisphosphate 7-phosphatase [Candidatus Nitrosotalea okcheonensis]|uniref:D,D-heptose 1,7-bisphosphate phosphatase n=1 Tax=Candidatus Nitrosotalea okcheonensis TaxID=1903276 RepID=A0A2H1FHX5_9ARCH|nr:HAD family hydrolase [Candidatus Nitrosotalea okcheonensis]SMH72292.1 putative D-glycero-D-manno-heptose-1,7-bisphosphate 7-phosphatase [Candidatus Nitrosotalea okcheonensis]